MSPDLREINRRSHPGQLIDIAQPALQMLEVPEMREVALEVAVIDRVESHAGGEQPDVGLGQSVAHHEALGSEPLVHLA